jgi:hypothetical protein
MDSIPQTNTFCSVSRFAGENKTRILNGAGSPGQDVNWLFGHDLDARCAAWYEGERVSLTNKGSIMNWLIMCGTTGGVVPTNFVIDQLSVGIGSGTASTAARLNVNYHEYGYLSDFELHSVYI